MARRTDYSSKAKSQGLRLVSDPDLHIDPSHVPDSVEDKVAECIQHSKQVLQRQINCRQNRLVSSLGAAWDINKAPIDGPYYLQCARSEICDNFEYVCIKYFSHTFNFIVPTKHRCENIYFLCDPDGIHGIFCCTACGEYFKKAEKRARVSSIGSKWRIWNKKDYRVFRKSDWDVSYTRSLSLLQWVLDNPAERAPRAKNKKKKKRKSTIPLPNPRDAKRSPSRQEILEKLTELTKLVKAFVCE